MMNKFIPLSIPNFEGNERKYVDDAIDQGWVSTGGAYINELENKMAEFLSVESVAACQSGTSAIHLALVDAGVMPGDMVAVTPLTFIAAVNPVRYQFAEPVFIDVDDSLCMDPKKLQAFIDTECEMREEKLIHKATEKHVKAAIIVHVFGNMADMEAFMEIAEKYNITIIEDATEALGTKYTSGKLVGKYAGTIGHYGTYSYNGNKIITTGGGGAVTASDVNRVNHMRYLSTQAKDDPHRYIHNEIGYNYRMTNVQAAIGVAQMEELPEFIERKNRNYDKYKELFRGFKYGELMPFRDGTESNKWFYSLKLDVEKLSMTIDEIIGKLQEQNIQTRAIWGLINEQKPYENCLSCDTKNAKYYSERILNIPCSTQITDEEICAVVEAIKEVISGE